jgi:hypothetical protein
LEALDAMPEKKLCVDSLQAPTGEFCTLGALGAARGIDMTHLDPEDHKSVANVFGIANAMTCEIVFMNDEADEHCNETQEQRWSRMRKWVASKIIHQQAPDPHCSDFSHCDDAP